MGGDYIACMHYNQQPTLWANFSAGVTGRAGWADGSEQPVRAYPWASFMLFILRKPECWWCVAQVCSNLFRATPTPSTLSYCQSLVYPKMSKRVGLIWSAGDAELGGKLYRHVFRPQFSNISKQSIVLCTQKSVGLLTYLTTHPLAYSALQSYTTNYGTTACQ